MSHLDPGAEQVLEIRGQYQTVEGHRICFDESGSGERGTLLCVHTAGMTSLEWRFFLPYFAALGYRVLAPDLPGHGKSLLRDWKPIESIHEYGEILWKLAQSLELSRAVLAGCSIGGDIVLDMAVHHPGEWSAVICCSAGIRNSTFPQDFLDRGMEDSGIPAFHEFNFYRTAALCGRETPAERAREIQWLRRRADPKIMIHDLLAWNRHDLTQMISRISVPTLLVRGADDSGVGQDVVDQAAKAIPGAELAVLPGVGHFPMTEYEGFALLVQSFLNRRVL
jgi:pimeloyl-ACP methyl ester carboxylesterase